MSRRRFDPLQLPLDGISLIEASAGTGKTFSLASLYLRLLIERSCEVRQILVMTFTRAATQELRERIRRRIAGAARLARDPGSANPGDSEDRFALALIEACPEPGAELARRLSTAACSMDQAAIFTIHGFSQQAAAEQAFDSALPFDRGEQVDDSALLDEVITDHWRAHALGGLAEPGFRSAWPLPRDLAADLAPWQTQPHAELAGPDPQEIGRTFAQALSLWRHQAPDWRENWTKAWQQRALKAPLRSTLEAAGGIEAALDRLETALLSDAEAPLLPDWVGRLSDEAEFMTAARHATLRADCCTHPLSLALAPLPLLARIARLRQARQQVADEAESRKRRRRQFSFNDMILALHRAISAAPGGRTLADALHRNWPWALVDEFQDTDPLQYAILQQIYRGRRRGGLILIGDPKQAIYAFRGGDVHAYLQAARDAGQAVYSLGTNYRSSAGLLQAVEALFRSPEDDVFLVDGIAFQPVVAGREDAQQWALDGRAQAALQIWQPRLDDTRRPGAQAVCLQACVAQVGALLSGRATIRSRDSDGPHERPVRPADIAILVNSNQEATQMQRALSRAGIAAVCLHRDSVFASAEARELLVLLRAAARPADGALIRAALSTTLLGRRLSDLVALQGDDGAWQGETERFQQAHERWRDHGVLAMLQGFIQAAANRQLGWPDGRRRLSNMLQLAELLAEAEPRCFGMGGLLDWLQQALHDAGRGEVAEAQQLRLDSDEELVRISTVHKAKGLEYALVLLPFAPWLGASGNPEKPPWRYHRHGRSLVDLGIDPNGRDAAVRERRGEALRLLYVALTRTAVGCFMPWCAANGVQNGALASLLHRDQINGFAWKNVPRNAAPLNPDAIATTLAALVKAGGGHIAVAPLPSGPPAAAPPGPAPAALSARNDWPAPRAPWTVTSFSRLLRTAAPAHAGGRAEDEDPPPVTAEPAETPSALPAGTRFGEAVHALLEQADPRDWPATGELPRPAREATIRALRRHGLAEDETTVQGTAALVRATWHTPLPEIGPLAALPATARVAEMEFHFRLGGRRLGTVLDLLREAGYARTLISEREAEPLRGLMHGYIDLSVEAGGRYYVIDYKTNLLGPDPAAYSPEALRHAVAAHHYDLQYLIYLTALHRYLARRLPDYDPARHLGGACYLFLRGLTPDAPGSGIHQHRPDPALILALDAQLDRSGS